jgi:16S rRNA (adenine1518-N6/adenine1519-N6)-dimethyltransferase
MNKPAQSPETELFDVVDEADQLLHTLSRGEVHAQGLRHRAVHIFLRTERGEIFLQRRSPLKDKCPNLWDSSAAGHLDAGEDYEVAAVRELEEELGLTGLELREIGRLAPCDATGQEFVRLYLTQVEKKKHVELRWPPAEIESGEWFSEGLIDEWVGKRPGDFAPGFLECWKIYRGQGNAG